MNVRRNCDAGRCREDTVYGAVRESSSRPWNIICFLCKGHDRLSSSTMASLSIVGPGTGCLVTSVAKPRIALLAATSSNRPLDYDKGRVLSTLLRQSSTIKRTSLDQSVITRLWRPLKLDNYHSVVPSVLLLALKQIIVFLKTNVEMKVFCEPIE